MTNTKKLIIIVIIYGLIFIGGVYLGSSILSNNITSGMKNIQKELNK